MAMGNHPREKFPRENYNGVDTSNRWRSESSMAREEEERIVIENLIIYLFILFIYCHREQSPFRQHASKGLVGLVREPSF